MAVIKNDNWLKDVLFNLKEMNQIKDLFEYEAFSEMGEDDVEMILEEAINIAQDMLDPLNIESEKAGLRFENNEVYMPGNYKDVWQEYSENGWTALPLNPEFGGGGIPYLLTMAAHEFLMAANASMALFVGLTAGAGRLIESFGTDDLKNIFLENMYTGVWTGSMCLTEPQAGSDLNLVKTKAVQDGDSYLITGQKIFITCGNHDLTENIIHLVLAKMEGAASGTEGISLFVVPKFLVNEDGSVGEFNHVVNMGIEDKMGYKASPTCTLQFENSRGFLVGEANRGLPQMFQLMNEARMMVGLVSLANTTQAYDHALDYAKERVQGSHITKPKTDPIRIIEHEDVRRMLMHMKAHTEGIRALIYHASKFGDMEEHEPDEAKREMAKDMLALLVPICKSYASDRSYELDREAIQVFGGYGFIKEYPVEQLARDTKINSIWEGTNYIQSMDLVGRKLGMKNGAVVMQLYQEYSSFCEANLEHAELAREFGLFKKGLEKLGMIIQQYMTWKGEGKLSEIAFTATRFLDSMAEIIISKLFLDQCLVALEKLNGDLSDSDKTFYESKIVTAKYYITNILPQSFSRIHAIHLGDKSAINMDEKGF